MITESWSAPAHSDLTFVFGPSPTRLQFRQDEHLVPPHRAQPLLPFASNPSSARPLPPRSAAPRQTEKADANHRAEQMAERLRYSSTCLLPRQLPKLRTASPAMPASNLLWHAIAMEVFFALAASRSPFSFGHVCHATTLWSRSNFQTLMLPDAIMAMLRANQRMRDFMQDRVNDFLGRILEYKENRKFDGAAMINAQPQ
jgi:hypothetical protein